MYMIFLRSRLYLTVWHSQWYFMIQCVGIQWWAKITFSEHTKTILYVSTIVKQGSPGTRFHFRTFSTVTVLFVCYSLFACSLVCIFFFPEYSLLCFLFIIFLVTNFYSLMYDTMFRFRGMLILWNKISTTTTSVPE